MIESMEPEAYKSCGYYEKWTYALAHMLLARKIITESEVGS